MAKMEYAKGLSPCLGTELRVQLPLDVLCCMNLLRSRTRLLPGVFLLGIWFDSNVQRFAALSLTAKGSSLPLDVLCCMNLLRSRTRLLPGVFLLGIWFDSNVQRFAALSLTAKGSSLENCQ